MTRLHTAILALAAGPLALALAAAAQTRPAPEAAAIGQAQDRYHAAAQAYVAGDDAAAVREAEAGLALDPGNAKLQQLLDLLRQDPPPEDDGAQDEGENEDGDEQQDGGEEQNSGQDGGAPQPDSEAERDGTDQNQPDDASQEDADPQASGGGREGEDRQGPQPGQGERRESGMSAAQAQRLLDAVGADEELLVSKMRRPGRASRSDRDW